MKTSTKNLQVITTKDNKRVITGNCNDCNSKKIVFIGDGFNDELGGSFDISKVLSTLGYINPWSKYPGELHIPGGYNYCGPGTRLDIRLDRNDKPKANEEPINATDAVCYQHDLDYREGGNALNKKHEADRVMIERLSNINPSNFKERITKSLISGAMNTKVKLGVGLVPLQFKDLFTTS